VSLRPPFVPEAVVFDLDGLLVDSEGAWGEAEERVVASYGKPWDPALRTLLLGRGPDDAARLVAEFVGADDPREVSRRLLQEAVRAFTRGIAPRPGAEALVGGLADRVPVAVATNSRRVLAELSLDSAGLTAFVDAVVCAEDVAAPKPAPDPYLTACRLIGADPARSVCLEDSPVGAASAHAAGLWVIACPSFPGTVITAADAVVASLLDLSPADFLPGGPGEVG
jgi:HAD superfamily hydrolase (TIGR01509 family)